ncbi:MAG: hypothetical protein HYY51_02325 [Candidatus Magasanikbacteria bacterium]|nr:hypothetical protein [Candidatus Magasanikbacteria bacterium]
MRIAKIFDSKKNRCLAAFFFIILPWYILLLVRPLDLSNDDLGRHLKNGEFILQAVSSLESIPEIFSTNFYSYTFPDFPFVNHHWGSGVLFYSLWSTLGPLGFQAFMYGTAISTLFIFFVLAYKKSNLLIASSVTFFLVPLVAERRELRPELFSYLFLGLFLLILFRYRDNPQYGKLPYLLPFIFLLWVNIHIFFIFGLFVLGLFFVDALVARPRQTAYTKKLGTAVLLCLIAGLITPTGVKTLLYPFAIFQNFGIQVQETLSLSQATTNDLHPTKAISLKISLAFGVLVFLYLIIHKGRKNNFLVTSLWAVFGFLAWNMIRNISMYALVAIPTLSMGVYAFGLRYFKNKSFGTGAKLAVSILVILSTLLIHKERIPAAWQAWGYGLASKSQEAGTFLRQNNIQGPLFNDFSSGGYVIFNLYPNIRPFVDNRPEAYPAEFFTDTYLPLRSDEEIWGKTQKQYGFNVLLLEFPKDPEPILFLIHRVNDPDWVPVFVNNYHVIFVRNNEQNADIIKQFEISKDAFRLEKTSSTL